MIAADRFPIDQSERPFNGSRPNFAFSIRVLPSFVFANRAYQKKKEGFSLLRLTYMRLAVDKRNFEEELQSFERYILFRSLLISS